jgi:hypothetical protein
MLEKSIELSFKRRRAGHEPLSSTTSLPVCFRRVFPVNRTQQHTKPVPVCAGHFDGLDDISVVPDKLGPMTRIYPQAPHAVLHDSAKVKSLLELLFARLRQVQSTNVARGPLVDVLWVRLSESKYVPNPRTMPPSVRVGLPDKPVPWLRK